MILRMIPGWYPTAAVSPCVSQLGKRCFTREYRLGRVWWLPSLCGCLPGASKNPGSDHQAPACCIPCGNTPWGSEPAGVVCCSVGSIEERRLAWQLRRRNYNGHLVAAVVACTAHHSGHGGANRGFMPEQVDKKTGDGISHRGWPYAMSMVFCTRTRWSEPSWFPRSCYKVVLCLRIKQDSLWPNLVLAIRSIVCRNRFVCRFTDARQSGSLLSNRVMCRCSALKVWEIRLEV